MTKFIAQLLYYCTRRDTSIIVQSYKYSTSPHLYILTDNNFLPEEYRLSSSTGTVVTESLTWKHSDEELSWWSCKRDLHSCAQLQFPSSWKWAATADLPNFSRIEVQPNWAARFYWGQGLPLARNYKAAWHSFGCRPWIRTQLRKYFLSNLQIRSLNSAIAHCFLNFAEICIVTEGTFDFALHWPES